MRKTHLILVGVLVWLLCGLAHADDGKSSHIKSFTITSQRIQILLQTLRNHLSAELPLADEVDQMTHLLTDFRAGHLLLTERFRQHGEQAETVGGSIRERQARMADRFLRVSSELLGLLQEMTAPAGVSSARLERALELLEQLQPQRHGQLHGQLPYQSLKAMDIPLQFEPVVVPAYRRSAAAANPEDLLSSATAPVSAVISAHAQAIAEQAQKLNWDPVDIYEWVKNNIATEWYRGGMKGAEETLRQRSGNDADQAALLIALLRAAGYPARYVRGVIEFFPGLASLRAATGIDDPDLLGNFLRKAGIPCQAVMAGGQIINYRVEHIWVETQVPYANYRGAMADNHGKIWVPLDTSIKVAGYEEQGSFDLYAAPGNPLAGMRANYLAATRTATPLEAIRDAATAFLAEAAPVTTYADLLHGRRQKVETAGLLPPGLQFTEVAVTGESPFLPADLMHAVNFRIGNDEALLDVTLPVHQLSNRKIALDFEAESLADHEMINLWGGLANTPAYLVRLRPVLLVDDQRLAVAGAGFAPGEGFDLLITLTSPAATAATINRVQTGYPLLFGLVAQQAVMPEAAASQPLALDLLHRAALDYVDRWNRGERELSELFKLSLARPLPDLVSLGGQLEVVELLGEPQELNLQGLFLDADLRSVAIEQRSGPADGRKQDFMHLSALHGSVLEDRLFIDNFGLAAISTAKLFGLAGDAGVPILTFDAGNVGTQLENLQLAENVRTDIAEALSLGWTVHVPAQPIRYFDWSGTGYIKEDPQDGAAGYMLSGMTAGGNTVTRTEAWSDLLRYLFNNPFSLPPNTDPDAACVISKLSVTDLQSGVVGQPFARPLTVYVRDSAGVPVRNALVTFTVLAGGGQLVAADSEVPVQGPTLVVPTNWRGLAQVTLVAGQSTAQSTLSWHTEGDEYATWASRQTVTATLASGLGLTQPFVALALPDQPQVMQALTAGGSGSILQYAGSVGASVQDQFGNPVANVPVEFTTARPSANSGLCDPAAANQTQLLAQLSTERSCLDQVPAWGECAVSGPVTGLSMSNGVVAAGVVLGSFPDGIYPVTAAYAGPALATPPADVTFALASLTVPGGACGSAVPPLAYFTLQREDYPVRPAGQAATLKVKPRLFAEGQSAREGVEILTCADAQQQCPQIQGDGRFNRITPQQIEVSIAGQVAVPSDEAPGVYAAQVSLALGQQVLPVAARAQRRVTLYDNVCADAGGCASAPSEETSTFAGDWQVTYTGVAIGGLSALPRLELDAEGVLLHDTPVNFTILPADYTAISASFLLYQDGFLVMSVPTAVSGTSSATLHKGFRFAPGSHYEVAAVLNYGWGDAEIRSERVALPSGTFDVKVAGVPGTWLSAAELEVAGAFVLLNNDLEAGPGGTIDDEFKAVDLQLPAIAGASQGSWSFTVANPDHLAVYDDNGVLLTAGQARQVTLPATLRLYLEGRTESAGLKADGLVVRFIPEGGSALEKTVPVTVVNFDLAVDGNRNRFLEFEKPADEEILFWVNNDYDDNSCLDTLTTPDTVLDPDLCQEDDLNSALEDARDNLIRTKRDLEDFARLHFIIGGNLPAGTFSFAARTEASAGAAAPMVNLFRAVDGTDKYLGFELDVNDRQPDLQLIERRLAMIGPDPARLAADWLPPGEVAGFLFEGLAAGRGDLVVTAAYRGVPVIEKRVRLDIREITDFYDHFLLAASGDDLHPVETGLHAIREAGYQPARDEYVVFIHGWNMEDWKKQRYAETMFKRLWWHGYQGGVGLFDWPCRTLPPISEAHVNYDYSEHRAWHAAAVLAGLLTDADRPIGGRHAGQVRILAHSQGNVVAGEAINLAPAGTVHSYVASQAALSASFYHPQVADFMPQLAVFDYQTPEVFGAYPGEEPVAPYLAQVPQKVQNGQLFSYFNEKDYALTTAGAILPAWEFNNRTRPDDSIGYDYVGGIDVYPAQPSPGEGFVKHDYESAPAMAEMTSLGTRDLRFPADRYEIFAFGAQSRAKALGAVQAPAVFSPQSKDLSALFGFDEKDYSHSRQFKSNIGKEIGYWSAFVDDADLILLGDSQE